jgi:LuxR family transcriptional regulator, maltose regulon positive regulatory protein
MREEILTLRERVFLDFASRGYTSTRIASELQISPCTVTATIRTAMLKLHVRSRTHAVCRAMELSLIPVKPGYYN